MERNDTGSETGAQGGGQTDANEFSGSGSTKQESGFDFAGTSNTSQESQGLKDRARNVMGTASDKLADVGSTVRDRAGMAKDKLASALESGAERLRERANGGTLAGATADGSTAIESDGRVSQVADRVAGGMEKSAEWLRDADLESLKLGVERQVKEQPGTTL